MSTPTQEWDVWVVRLKAVYPRVPYSVVSDWIQEGRLAAQDRVRPAGGTAWQMVQDVPALAAFLPRPQPLALEDRAAALEPIAPLFATGARRPDDDEGDVDMVPLIDVSLVLLIFFLMTATVSSGLLSPIKTPAAHHQLETITQDTYWVGIDKKEQGNPWYCFGVGDKYRELRPEASGEERYGASDPDVVLTHLKEELQSRQGEVRIRLRAHEDLPIEVVQDMTRRLQRLEGLLNQGRPGERRLRFIFLGEVSEPQTP
jgi:hypothetical protein